MLSAGIYFYIGYLKNIFINEEGMVRLSTYEGRSPIFVL